MSDDMDAREARLLDQLEHHSLTDHEIAQIERKLKIIRESKQDQQE
jgi:hypothetical protein